MAANKHMYESLSPKVLAPLVEETAKEIANRLTEPALPTDGIYYVVRYPDKWDIFAYRFDNFPETDHSALWTDYLAPILSRIWSKALKLSPQILEQELSLHTYGFPRGRVTNMSGRFKVLHGGDTTALVPASRIERAFDLSGMAKWERDGHEQCQGEDKEAIRSLLKIKENWPAVSADYGF